MESVVGDGGALRPAGGAFVQRLDQLHRRRGGGGGVGSRIVDDGEARRRPLVPGAGPVPEKDEAAALAYVADVDARFDDRPEVALADDRPQVGQSGAVVRVADDRGGTDAGGLLGVRQLVVHGLQGRPGDLEKA